MHRKFPLLVAGAEILPPPLVKGFPSSPARIYVWGYPMGGIAAPLTEGRLRTAQALVRIGQRLRSRSKGGVREKVSKAA